MPEKTFRAETHYYTYKSDKISKFTYSPLGLKRFKLINDFTKTAFYPVGRYVVTGCGWRGCDTKWIPPTENNRYTLEWKLKNKSSIERTFYVLLDKKEKTMHFIGDNMNFSPKQYRNFKIGYGESKKTYKDLTIIRIKDIKPVFNSSNQPYWTSPPKNPYEIKTKKQVHDFATKMDITYEEVDMPVSGGMMCW